LYRNEQGEQREGGLTRKNVADIVPEGSA